MGHGTGQVPSEHQHMRRIIVSGISCQRLLDNSPHHHRSHGSKHQPGVEE
jgi:hypothetical protein